MCTSESVANHSISNEPGCILLISQSQHALSIKHESLIIQLDKRSTLNTQHTVKWLSTFHCQIGSYKLTDHFRNYHMQMYNTPGTLCNTCLFCNGFVIYLSFDMISCDYVTAGGGGGGGAITAGTLCDFTLCGFQCASQQIIIIHTRYKIQEVYFPIQWHVYYYV